MGRPIKTGLDYFPVDISFDDNVELLQAECGIYAIGVLIKLWQKIYRNGYFIVWDEDAILLFNQRNGLIRSQTDSILEVCFRRNIFSRSMYESHGILTSSGIQKRFLQISKDAKRKTISIYSEFKLVNGEFSGIITEETHIDSDFSTQRKGKERKGKDISEETINSEETHVNEKQKKHKFGVQKNVLLTDDEYGRLTKKYNNCEEIIDWFSNYIVEKGYHTKSHNLSIQRWVADAVEREKQKKKTKGNGNVGNFNQRTYDFDNMFEDVLKKE